MQDVFDRLGLQVLQRDWLSSNNIVFRAGDRQAAALVDTGYDSHSAQTVELVSHALQGQPLGLIANTHLHSDHCGGNAALQARWPEVVTRVAAGAFDAVDAWDEDRLTYRLTGQTCRPFRVDGRLEPGTTVTLGGRDWDIHATGGHDPDAVVLFEPRERVLISGDALWRDKVAVIFPELDGVDGFAPALASLDLIESLNPAIVIPGHGAPFREVEDALAIGRQRLRHLQERPERHARHALRVLMMFHLLEHRHRRAEAVCRWMAESPMARRPAVRQLLKAEPDELARMVLQSLIDDRIVTEDGDAVVLT